MQRQSGNFLLQSLLALTLVFAFIPFVARKLVNDDIQAQMYSATRQIDVAQTASRIYIRENLYNLPYETTILDGNKFVDTLEPYGLPLGFVPHNALGQDIRLVIVKNVETIYAYLDLIGGNLTGVQRSELARRIGFYASATDDGVRVGIVLDDVFSDVVRRKENNIYTSPFLTSLDMGGYDLNNVNTMMARRGEFDTGQFNTLTVTGTENSRKERSVINEMITRRTVFQSKTGESALSLVRGTMYADSVLGRTISKFGDTGNLTVNSAGVYNFSMTSGHTNFVGPEKWDVRGNLVTDNINFSVEQLEVKSFINTSRGQNAYIDEETLEYSAKSGIDVGTLYTSHITLRDQISSSLASGGTGQVILDIRPRGTSVFPDVLLSGINNDWIKIISEPDSDDGALVDCKSEITKLDMTYNAKSLSQYIVCQYLYWERLEERINIKKCLQGGGDGCK